LANFCICTANSVNEAGRLNGQFAASASAEVSRKATTAELVSMPVDILVVWGPPVLFERAAEYLDKLLKGEKVSNLPVQQATAFELIVNSRTASALGLTVPPNILLRADDVIE
jgi:ABC transporter substrate binding protein